MSEVWQRKLVLCQTSAKKVGLNSIEMLRTGEFEVSANTSIQSVETSMLLYKIY